MLNIGLVVSNCQSQPLKHTLSLMSNMPFENMGVQLISGDQEQYVSNFVRQAREKYSVIVCVALSENYGPLALNRVRDTFRGKSVVTIANLYYEGLHPDLTYIGGLAQRLEGPLGDYHSRLALIGFLTDRTVEQTVALFNRENYARLGYFDAHRRSIEELARRDEGLDIPAAGLVESMVRQVPIFMAVNHPTAQLINAYSESIADHLDRHCGVGRSEWTGGPMQLLNHLAQNAVFPVYPEVAKNLGLAYAGSYSFKPATIGDEAVNTLTLREFVEDEFSAFKSIAFDELKASHQSIILAEQLKKIDLVD